MMQKGRIFLRALIGEDAGLIFEESREAGMLRFLPGMDFQNLAHAHFFIESIAHSLSFALQQSAGHFFAAVRRSDGALLGIAGVAPREEIGMEIGYLIFARYRSMGYGLEAGRLVLEYARGRGVSVAHALTLPGNKASVAVLKRLGFFRVGGLRAFIGGAWTALEHYKTVDNEMTAK